MKYDITQIIATILMVVGIQGVIRQLIDHQDAGLLAWMPGGMVAQILASVLIAIGGLILGGWAHTKAEAIGRRSK